MRYAVYPTDKMKLVIHVVKRDIRRYLRWKHSWKTTSIGVAAVFVAVVTAWNVLHSSALTAIIVPNSDVTTTGWVVGASADTTCAGGTLCDTVDEGVTDNTSDYIQTSTTSGGETEEFALDNSITNVASVTQLAVRIYAKASTVGGGTVDTISVNLRMSGTLQTAGTCTPGNGSWVACTVNFNGSWNQTALDSAQVQLVRNRLGSGNPNGQADTTQVSNVYATVTYTSALQFSQSAYRWFNNSSKSTLLKSYGGTSNDHGQSVVQTSDGGYAVTGYTYSFGVSASADMFIAKYDGAGTLSWYKTWGGSSEDMGTSIVQTSDGGYAVTGHTYSSGSGGDTFIVKYNSTGSVSWNKTWGSGGADLGQSIVQTSDGGYAVTGRTNGFGGSFYKMFIIKYDSTGAPSWNKTWGGTSGDAYGQALVQTTDGGYAITGYTTDLGASGYDMTLVKYDSAGNLSWSKLLGGSGTDLGQSIVQTSDGGYAVTGSNQSHTIIAKFDSSGNVSWDKTWSGSGSDSGNSIVQTSDGGYAVTGNTSSFGAGSSDLFLSKYDSSGNISWTKTVGGAGSDNGFGLVQTADGGYAVAGDTASFTTGGSDTVLAKFSGAGTINGCSSPSCQTASPSSSTPTVTASSPTAAESNPSATTGTPSLTITSPVVTTTVTAEASIDVDTSLAAQDTSATAPGEGTTFRLRMDLHISGAQLDASAGSFKLQYALKGAGTCSAPTGSYADVTDTTSGIRYADNSAAASGIAVLSNANDPKHGTDTNVNETYQEKGTTTFTNPNIVSIGQDGMWDFGLVAYHSIGGDHYCFKVIKSDGSDLTGYTVYPEITIPAATFSQAAFRWYNPDPAGSAVTFAKAYGTSGTEQISSGVTTSDGGYMATGYVSVTGKSSEILLAKYDSSGNLSWSKNWGGTSSDAGNSVTQTSDGGYAVTGYTTSFGAGSSDIIIAKFDSAGNFSWSKTWGNTGDDVGNAIVQTSDGGYAVTGYTSNSINSSQDMVLIKYDSTGTVSWDTMWGGSGVDMAHSVIQTSDGGYAVTGDSSSYGAGGYDAFLNKYTSTGTLSWSKTWGGTGDDEGHTVIQTSDGGYAITGVTYSFFDTLAGDMYLAKFTSTGATSWGSLWGGFGGTIDSGQSLTQTPDGGYVVTGYTSSYGAGSIDVLLTKYTSTGTLSWSRTWGGSSGDTGVSLVQAADGGYAVFGYTSSYGAGGGFNDLLMVKFDGSGNIGGCSSPMCQSPSPHTQSLVVTAGAGGSATMPARLLNSPSLTGADWSAITTVVVVNASNRGNPLAAQNKSFDLTNLAPMNLRIAVAVDSSGINVNGQTFKLQYAPLVGSRSCNATTSSYNDVTTGTPIAYYDDSAHASGDVIGADVNDPSDGSRTTVPQTYQESNNFSNSVSALYAGQDGIWQFSLTIDSATIKGRAFCLRVYSVTNSGQLTAANIAEVANSTQTFQRLRQGNWWNQEGKRQFINL